MLTNLFLKFVSRGPFWYSILLLQIPAWPLYAADQPLVVGHLPLAVARGAVPPLDRVPGTNLLRLAFSLPLRHASEFTNLLASTYNPASPEYHHYLTPQAFAARFGPSPADYASVIQFARTNGLAVAATHANRLLVDVTGRVADVERALHLKLNYYRHPVEPRDFFAPDCEPTVDARLPLLQVSGLDDFSRPHPTGLAHPLASSSRRSPNGGSAPDGISYMGNDFRQAYVPGTALMGAGQSVGLVEFDGFFPGDITNYANLIGLTNNLPQVTVVPVDGGVCLPGVDVQEVSLDIEMVLSMAPGVSNIFVYEATNGAPWVDMLSQMAETNLAAQLSCSWCGGGPDPASEEILQQMAAQGQSFFNASGDFGAYTNAAEIPFPCASPNITQVGGTILYTDTNGDYLQEAAWQQGSGGIAASVGIPVWQMGLDMTTNGGSTVWRNIPDVALTAQDVYVYFSGQGTMTGGTSCAAPLWAAYTALANQQAAQLGQPPVGFLNPAIYSLCRGTNYPATFHDITIGYNISPASPTNFFATPGYDLCTGWGTPAGAGLINALTTPDPLGILPQNVFSASGQIGGPFPQTNWLLTLTNSGGDNLDWSLGGVPAWLTVSAVNGTLAASGSTNLNVQWSNPNGMPVGGYPAALMFTNEDLSRVQNVLVQIDIGPIVQNGGFETGDFTGWTLLGDTITWQAILNVVTNSAYPGVVHSGNFGALLGENGCVATLSQTVSIIPGQQYLVSFWLDNLLAVGCQQFSALWNGVNLTSLTNPPAFNWSCFQFVVLADDTNATLEFAAENDQNYFGLDDVTVIPLPPMPPPPVAITGYSISTNGFAFTWPSLAGSNYLVQCATDLAQGNWLNLATVAAGTSLTTFVDTNSPAGASQ